MNRIDPPSTSLAVWRERGLEPILPLPDDTPAQALQLEGSFGEEFWFGTQNFYVITRYNRSHMYALAVYQLSQEIKTAKIGRASCRERGESRVGAGTR